MRIIGINLSAEEKHGSGVSQLEDNKIKTFTVYKDNEIIELISSFNPDVVVFDTPLSLTAESYRGAEKELIALGFSPEPQNMGNNKYKIKRAISLKNKINQKIKILETNVSFVKRILNIQDPKQLQNVRIMNLMKNQFEKDSVFAAITGLFYLENMFDQFGDEEEGFIIAPKV